MNKEELCEYEDLESYLVNALRICDPYDFQIRQRSLLLKLASIVLKPLYEERERIKQESASSDQSTSDSET